MSTESYTYQGSSLGTTNHLKCENIGTIAGGQDGASFGKYLFRFDHLGNCSVYNTNNFKLIDKFALNRTNVFRPHSNAVCFGAEYYEKTDDFPLLYTNIYNNYSNEHDRLLGCCGVYRITRSGTTFSGELVQVIHVGFTDDLLWKSDGLKDVRPFGNMVVDTDTGSFYVFTMRDKEQTTRYFRFDLPRLSDGEMNHVYGVNEVMLEKGDIRDYFDCEYSHYLQGACYYGRMIYSTEGFDNDQQPGRIQIIDLNAKKQYASLNIRSYGLLREPEFIHVFHGCFWYGDEIGRLYRFDFE
ncbi:MAG: hypothetical protein ACYCWE_11660 [Eubacteriales bacterium]